MIEITDKPIDVQKIIDTASTQAAGGINVFIGTVRNATKNKKVQWLEYESYESMAIMEMGKIVDEAMRRWRLLGHAISHRVGTLKPGEIAVVVAVSTPHRKESFEACQFIIDELKAKVTIWKKEIFEDGEQWVSVHP